LAYAFAFPGQGVQEVGMGKDFYDEFSVSRDVFLRVDEALGFPLSKIIFEGPEEELTKTEHAQPAILTVSIAAFEALKAMSEDLGPSFVAGHSLGEYTALVASEALKLEDGVRLVNIRGKLMQQAVPLGVGAMAAIIGLDKEAVEELCQFVSTAECICEPVNYNSPQQIVVSGHAEAVKRVAELAKERGARRALMLNVSAPFHSSLMRPVAEGLAEAFKSCEWRRPKWPVVANVNAKPLESVEEIQNALLLQSYNPVLWTQSVVFMKSSGVNAFLEIGPGNVLAGLIKKTIKDAKVYSLDCSDKLKEALDFIGGAKVE